MDVKETIISTEEVAGAAKRKYHHSDNFDHHDQRSSNRLQEQEKLVNKIALRINRFAYYEPAKQIDPDQL